MEISIKICPIDFATLVELRPNFFIENWFLEQQAIVLNINF